MRNSQSPYFQSFHSDFAVFSAKSPVFMEEHCSIPVYSRFACSRTTDLDLICLIALRLRNQEVMLTREAEVPTLNEEMISSAEEAVRLV